MSELTVDVLAAALGMPPAHAAAWLAAVAEVSERFQVNTPARLAAFLAQTAHESWGYTRLAENLNYSAEALRATFPSHFTPEDAAVYARKPEAIGNRAYANRLGNGDEASGDGFKFRGRGLIQVTGRENYAACGRALGEDVCANPDLLASPRWAVLSAGWFWAVRSLNPLADAGDMETMTKRINGGLNGLQDRLARWERAKAALGAA